MWLFLFLHFTIIFLLWPNCIAIKKDKIKEPKKPSKEKIKSGNKGSREAISKPEKKINKPMENPKMNQNKMTKNTKVKTPPPETPTKSTPTTKTSSESPRLDSGQKKDPTKNNEIISKQKKEEKEPKMKIIRKKCLIKSDINWKKKYKMENINVQKEFERLDKEYKLHRKNNCRINWEKCQYCNDYRDRLKALYEIGDDLNIMWKMEDRLLEFDEIYEMSYASWRKITKKEKTWIRAFKKYDNCQLPIEFTTKQNKNKEDDTQDSDKENSTQDSDKSDKEEEDTQKDDEDEKCRTPPPTNNEKEDG